jgi:multidrug efflux pump subunit AcrA (membrane-fusion protein)
VTRLRQLISLLETSLSGDDILLIFPDATGPAVLSALIGGIPLNRVHEHPFAPGELRLDVNYKSVRANWPSSPSKEYTAAIARGQEHLKVLRNTDPDTILNVREQDYLREQLLAEKEAAKVQAKQEAAREEAKTKQRARQGQQEQVKRLGIQQREAEKEAERAERRANYVSASQGPMDAVSLLGLGLAAAMVAWKDNSENPSISDKESDTTGKVKLLSPTGSTPDHDQIPKYENEMIIQSGDSRTEPSLENRFGTGAALESLTEIHQELADLESKIEKAPIEIQGFKSGAQIKAERLERAQQAMDQYMSSDDGGEAWLSVMLALAKEDDHDDMEA